MWAKRDDHLMISHSFTLFTNFRLDVDLPFQGSLADLLALLDILPEHPGQTEIAIWGLGGFRQEYTPLPSTALTLHGLIFLRLFGIFSNSIDKVDVGLLVALWHLESDGSNTSHHTGIIIIIKRYRFHFIFLRFRCRVF